jgi:predicted RNA-binding protein with PUA-like domain
MKSEPTSFSIDDLIKRPKQTTPWDGVRNYQARNMMRDQMKIGDQAFFYNSNCDIPGIVGIMEVASEAYPDPTQFDPESKYFDPKATPNKPIWFLVDLKFKEKFKQIISLEQLRKNPLLENLIILRKGNRLSITPVSPQDWQCIMSGT